MISGVKCEVVGFFWKHSKPYVECSEQVNEHDRLCVVLQDPVQIFHVNEESVKSEHLFPLSSDSDRLLPPASLVSNSFLLLLCFSCFLLFFVS